MCARWVPCDCYISFRLVALSRIMRFITRRLLLKSVSIAAISLIAARYLRNAVMSTRRTIVVGGGLAGLSAAHTALENGATVVLLDKKPA